MSYKLSNRRTPETNNQAGQEWEVLSYNQESSCKWSTDVSPESSNRGGSELRNMFTYNLETYPTVEQAKQAAVEELTSGLHDEWRRPRLCKDGTYRPQEEKTTDQAWIEKHNTEIVDIANSDFADLPQDWKQEYQDSAQFLVDLFHKNGLWEALDLVYCVTAFPNEYDYKELASQLHKYLSSRPSRNIQTKGVLAKGLRFGVDSFDKLYEFEKEDFFRLAKFAVDLAHSDHEIAFVTLSGDDKVFGMNKYKFVQDWRTEDDEYDDDDEYDEYLA